MSLSKPDSDNVFQKALKAYIQMLQHRPIFTKSCTSAFTGALGNFISQLVVSSPKSIAELNLRSIGAYAAAGFIFIGPSVHHFHLWMERHIPKGQSYMAVKRLMLDRLVFSPSFLFVLLYLLAILEGQPNEVALARIRETYWTALKMNWKVWTPLQYINVKYIPQMYRAPFMSFMALLWTVYISVKIAR